MIEYFVKSMLGTLGGGVLDFMKHNPAIVAGVMAIWLALFVAGRLQLWHIQRKSAELVVAMSRQFIADKPHITSSGLYKHIYPSWSQSLRQWAWFIPHRLDLWPIPVRPEMVQQKFPFSPQWIAGVLRDHDIKLDEHDNNIP